MNLAVGLFHFNPHWNLDVRSAHRHCSEALWPLLKSLMVHRTWRLTIEMSGSGLEFVKQSYPEYFRLLSGLVDDGRVELISSLYTPSIWVAFPRRDLIRSIEINKRCIASLGLPWSRTFFAQEAFFGAGVSTLREYFDTAICKDDFLTHYLELDLSHPVFTLNGMQVVVASGHLLNELAASFRRDPELLRHHGLFESHADFLRSARDSGDVPNASAGRGQAEGVRWLWYHCGDGNHFGTMHKPDDLERCYFDPTWKKLCERQMQAYEDSGYELATVRELIAALDPSVDRELPPIVEGAWNPRQAEGLLRWMGHNSSPWEDDCAVLTAIARARARLVAAERALHSVSARAALHLDSILHDAWVALLHAQISDALGWWAGPQAVQSSLQNSERALIAANRIVAEVISKSRQYGDDDENANAPANSAPGRDVKVLPLPELFGADGSGSFSTMASGLHVYDCKFTAVHPYCGLRLPFDRPAIVYCPSGLEERPARIPVCVFRQDDITLPLANGLLEVGEGMFLIKDTSYVHVAAHINLRSRFLEFAVRGSKLKKPYTWRFYFFVGDLGEAVAAANRLNSV